MSCNVKYIDLIFTIEKISRFKIKEYYVFIGTLDNDMLNVLQKLEKREKGMVITKDDQLLLKKNYSKYYLNWINIIKNKHKIKFIQNKIHIDDTISEIRKKIFVFMSDEENKKFILPENQELWLEKEDKTFEIIGYYYENNINEQKEFTIPHINEEFKASKDNNYVFNDKNLKKKTDENNMLIYDLLESGNFKKELIYLCDAKEEESFLKSKKINISTSLINKYFKKYWPYVNLSYNYSDIKNNYLLLKDYYEKENKIFDMIKNVSRNNDYFGSCNILTAKIGVNKINNSINNILDEDDKYIDLFPIFDYLRENKIDEKTPFIKYSEDILEAPFSIISKKALDNNMISKDNLKEWIGLKDQMRRMNGINIKRHLKDYDNKPRYSSIFLSKAGKIMINISFLAENNANFKDIELTIKDCKKLMDDINKNRIVKKIDEKQKIDLPDIEIIDNQINFKHNTQLIFTNIIIPLKLDKELDFKKLLEFSKKFPFFISDASSESTKKDESKDKIEKSIKLKYKRISGFANMNDIIHDIDMLKEKYDKDTSIIIKILESKYQKSIDEIKKYLIEWEKKYSSSKSTKISSEFKTGIIVTITNNNILMNGITKIYQIPLIYKFFVTFLTLFINYDDYIKNKDFKKVFLGKNIEENKKYYNEDYEINSNVSINIDQIYNQDYDFDNDLYLNDDFETMNEEGKNKENLLDVNGTKIEGLAEDSEIDPNIKLKCDDLIPEKDTCEDFCNDQKYFLRRLQRYDNKLFNPKIDKKDKIERYSRKCQESINRQPVVMPYDPATNPKINQESFTYSVKYKSDPTTAPTYDRWYICPKIWCPYCEIPISESQIDKKTIRVRATKDQGGKCTTALCPYGNHQVFIREYGHNFPGFLDESFHPQGLCLPCCFKKTQKDPKYSSYTSFKKCIGDDVENEVLKDGQIYILGKGTIIEKDRYGRLPIEIASLLKTNLDTGYLGFKSGYLRKGIMHNSNNSFLSAICDILSCDKKNLKIDLKKIKNILVEKINEDLFRSLHSGNLPNIFHNPSNKLSPLTNYKNYILNNNIDINHKYLWDFLQKENILFDEGINIFIFEKNTLLCPKGENIKYFYDPNKKSILLIKSKEYYEPIYYLEGNGKLANVVCIFNNDKEEIRKIYDISLEGCKVNQNINWLQVLKDNIKKYDLKIDNEIIDNGFDLQTAINEILVNVKNKKLGTGFIPVLQYVDNYNKVFGIKLNNGLYLPISPSKLIIQIKYKVVNDINEIDKIDMKNIIKLSNEVASNTKLNCKITHKILDLKTDKYVVALVNENNRFIPIKKCLNKNDKLKISQLNYYSDVDESLSDKIEKSDKRNEIINKKKFEDETFIRMKFELSKYIQIKENKNYLDKILEIINSENKDIKKNRAKMMIILNDIYSKLTTRKNNNIDYYDYIQPNKRVPCYLRSINPSDTKNIKLSCASDPHCIVDNKICKLFINDKNLLEDKRKYNNYDYYIARIVDELLRFKMKRNEILNDNIPTIINKELIEFNNNKYVIIHSINYNEINNIVDTLFLDNKGIYLDNRNLYEEVNTKELGFKKDTYIKSNKIIFKNHKIETLSIYWSKFFGNKFNVKIASDDNIFSIIINVLNTNEMKDLLNENVTIPLLKSKIIQYLKNIIVAKNKNITFNENSIMDLYKKEGTKIFKYTTSFLSIIDEINSEDYNGSEIDLLWISRIFNLNIVILDKRIKKNNIGYKFIKSNNVKVNYYILFYKSIVIDNDVYNIIQSKNKIIFKMNDLPSKFIQNIMVNENEK